MSVEALPRADQLLEDEENFAHIDLLWMTNLVDIINSAFDIIEKRLAAGGL